MTTHDIFHQTICHDAAGDLDAALMAEYTGQMDPALEERVKQGFLMPILFGYFGSDDDRSTMKAPFKARLPTSKPPVFAWWGAK